MVLRRFLLHLDTRRVVADCPSRRERTRTSPKVTENGDQRIPPAPNERSDIPSERAFYRGGGGAPYGGPAEVDEKHTGGKRENMSNAKRDSLEGRGAVGKRAIPGVKDRATNQVRAEVVESTDKAALQEFVVENTAPHAVVCSMVRSLYPLHNYLNSL